MNNPNRQHHQQPAQSKDPLDGLEIVEVFSRVDTPGGTFHWHKTSHEFSELEGGHMLITPKSDNPYDPKTHVILSSGSWVAHLRSKASEAQRR